MRLNIVMLVRDRKALTIQAIRSMYKNKVAPNFDLTVVDDASSELVNNWIARTPNVSMHVIRNEVSAGTGAARNQGVLAARARFGDDNLLYLTDNDVFFQPGWDKVLLAAHDQFRGFKIIGGGCHPFMQPHDMPYLGVAGTEHRMTSRDAVSGYSWLLDWGTWDTYGPLESNALGVRQGEDWSMCQRIRKAGYYVGSVTPEVVLHTGVTDTFGERPPGWGLIEAAKVPGVIYQ